MALNDPQEDRPAVRGGNHNAQQNQRFTGSVDRHRIQVARLVSSDCGNLIAS